MKLCDTGAAGAYVASPAWFACTVQVPAPTIVIVEPFTPPDVHTPAGDVTVNVTGFPEPPPVAATVTGASP